MVLDSLVVIQFRVHTAQGLDNLVFSHFMV